jgi:hypothetical protein
MKIIKFLLTTCAVGVASLFVFVSLTNAAGIGDRLRGRILLQVESHGEAWYINPDTGRRHYMGTAADAYQLMRRLGLGISNADFDRFGSTAPQRLAGKILIKVEDHGKAYYVNPVDLSLHFLGSASDAYQVMRRLGLGVKNADLGTITVEEDSESVASTPTQVTTAPEPTDDDSGSTSSGCENCSNIREYNCPRLVEFEFTQPANLSSLLGYFVSAGPPVLRLTHAEIQDDQLACVFEDSFASADVSSIDNEFAFTLSSGGSICPTFLGLNIRDKETVVPDWNILYPGYVRVDKNHQGHRGVVTLLYQVEIDWAHTYDGCVYNTTLQSGSDPTLRQTKRGYCIVNDNNDGFKCADSLAEMYGTDNATPTLSN